MDREFIADYFDLIYENLTETEPWKNDELYQRAHLETVLTEKKIKDLSGGLDSEIYAAVEYYWSRLMHEGEYICKYMFLAGAEARERMLR